MAGTDTIETEQTVTPPSDKTKEADDISKEEQNPATNVETGEGSEIKGEADKDELVEVKEEEEVVDTTEYPHENWMGNLPEGLHEVPLTQLALPGSHDSLAIKRDMSVVMPFSPYNPDIAKCIDQLPSFPLFDNFRTKLKEMNRDWSATQSATLMQQLKFGVRYFDIRVAKHHGLIFGEHGLFSGEVWKYLAEIKTFLDDHPKEIVLMYFQNLNNLDEKDIQTFILRLRQMFGQRIIPRTQIQMTTLNSLWQYGQQVMLLFKDEKLKLLNRTAARQIWPADTILYNPWPNMQEGHHLVRFLDKHYENAGADTESRFHVSQGVLSPTIDMVFAGKLEHSTLEEMALDDAQPRLLKWMDTKTSLYVLMVDFVNQQIVDRILQFNKE